MRSHSGRLMRCCKVCFSCIRGYLERKLSIGLVSEDVWIPVIMVVSSKGDTAVVTTSKTPHVNQVCSSGVFFQST